MWLSPAWGTTSLTSPLEFYSGTGDRWSHNTLWWTGSCQAKPYPHMQLHGRVREE